MSSFSNGRFLGRKSLDAYTSSDSAIWKINDLQQSKRDVIPGVLESSPVTSPQELTLAEAPAGDYWIKPNGFSSAIQMYFKPGLADVRGWVRVFSSPYSGTATVNLLNQGIPWKGILVQRSDNQLQGYTYFSTNQLYNSRTSTSTSSGGNRSGYRVYLGGPGAHGIYNTSQSPCNWGNSSGAVGAGYDGSTCGSFPNNLIWGTGTSGAAYTNRSGTWEHWIWWE